MCTVQMKANSSTLAGFTDFRKCMDCSPTIEEHPCFPLVDASVHVISFQCYTHILVSGTTSSKYIPYMGARHMDCILVCLLMCLVLSCGVTRRQRNGMYLSAGDALWAVARLRGCAVVP